MKTEFVAKVYTPIAIEEDEWEIGTAYPIGKDRVITARHVVFPDSGDGKTLGEVVWTDFKDESGQEFTSQIESIEFDGFDGSKNLDIVVISCTTPAELNVSFLLTTSDPKPDEAWDSFGYPKAGKDEVHGIRNKIPNKGTFFHPDSRSHILHLDCSGVPITPELWKGMSGALVFNRNNELVAVISEAPPNLPERLYAVSIPYLLRTDEEFKKAVGYPVDADTITNLLPDVKLGEDFKAFLHNQISAELKLPDAKYLNEQLAELFKHDRTAENLETLITDSLLSNQVDKAIGDYLTLAASDCISSTGCRFHEVGGKLDKVREVAEQILGWLVLASIDENKIQQILPNCEKHKSYYFSLGVNSIAGVEIVLSRRFDRKVTWTNKDKNSPFPTSPHRIKLDNTLLKWDDRETLNKILIEIWNQVFPALETEKKEGDKFDQGELDFLNGILEERRNHPRKKEHHYIAFKVSEASSDFTKSIYEQLLNRLPQMTVVQFGIQGTSDNLFVIPEANISVKVSQFYHVINS